MDILVIIKCPPLPPTSFLIGPLKKQVIKNIVIELKLLDMICYTVKNKKVSYSRDGGAVLFLIPLLVTLE